MATDTLLKALAVTAELTGTQLSVGAARMMADDLSVYPEIQVLGALTRCRKELKGRICVADVVSRLDDGRPDAQEAWSMVPFDESRTVAWTEEMAGAWGVALPLIEEGDMIGARMAFLESYRTRVQRARDAGAPVKWSLSLGYDREGRQAAIEEAVRLGRITRSIALMLGHTAADGAVPEIAVNLAKRLTGRA